MKKRIQLFALILIFSLPMTGCSLIPSMYEMTEEEEAEIVAYAAKVVGKYNGRQGDGMVRVSEADFPQPEPEEPEEPEVPEDEQENTDSGSAGTSDETETTPADEGTKAMLSDALGINNIDIGYEGFTFGNNYTEGDYLSLTPASGTHYLVMNFSLKNNGSKEAEVDVLSKHPTFTVSVDGSERIRNSSTILLYDLATFQGTIAAGGQADTVLLFEVPKDIGKKKSSLILQMTVDTTLYNIVLN